ncbi:lipopolysaccharide heptosyltransferase I [Magnetococcus marinus MC-1]|uniref:Lipopolysaccharide heptosyltransferase 1 n=1 Tax=Magnetococcus marinus (strain ATCC BAA-1437 / JCM 17883 / MC-1) TaxID=156889 RepID=A0L7W6_MAGMM|nr:lipopolysaccharide heptosyltransferase I [Magnetococcus marinus]ABK44059.1 lipopolysaccharide heptosyltransferase I [Magnetococcus marinus MC-1]
MSRLLLVKFSSMGDLIHMLPAVTDSLRAIPHLQLDWLVEEAFQAIPSWHPGVGQRHIIGLRRWKKAFFARENRQQMAHFIASVRQTPYDCVIDAQGLMKSALTARLCAPGTPLHGPSKQWAREPLACHLYHHRHGVAKPGHVITQLRQLMAASLGYSMPTTPADFGIERSRLPACPPWWQDHEGAQATTPYLIFLHGAGWSSKAWPEPYWVELARQMGQQHPLPILLPWGSVEEFNRAQRIAAQAPMCQVLPQLSMAQVAALIADAAAVVGLDSGFAHLAAALNTPHITLYGATNPDYSGVAAQRGALLRSSRACAPCMQRRCPLSLEEQGALAPPCFTSLPPAHIATALTQLLERH